MRRYLPPAASIIAPITALSLALCAGLTGCVDSSPAPRRQPQRTAHRPTPRPRVAQQNLQQCLAALTRQQAVFTDLEDRYYGNSCQTVGTVKLAALNTDSATITVTNLGPVTCGVATPFAAWTRYGVDRAAQQILGSRLVKIETFGSYSCRNVAGTNRRSGHAMANAIDVAAFDLADGRHVSVLHDWDGGTADERRFLRVVHDSACKRFGTTLGPGYNAAHQNHLHLEADGASFCR